MDGMGLGWDWDGIGIGMGQGWDCDGIGLRGNWDEIEMNVSMKGKEFMSIEILNYQDFLKLFSTCTLLRKFK